jgi:hypothetical protein
VESADAGNCRRLNALDQKSRAISKLMIAPRSRSTPAASTNLRSPAFMSDGWQANLRKGMQAKVHANHASFTLLSDAPPPVPQPLGRRCFSGSSRQLMSHPNVSGENLSA